MTEQPTDRPTPPYDLRVVKQHAWPRVTRYRNVTAHDWNERTRELTITHASGKIVTLQYPQGFEAVKGETR